MYYQPDGTPHIKTTLESFKSPRNRKFPMTVSYCEGGPTLRDTSYGLLGFVWKAFIRDDGVYIKREDQANEELIFTRSGITQLDITFDQSMRPFVVYVADGQAYYYHFNVADSSYSEVSLGDDVEFPRVAIDTPEQENINTSDVIIAYTRAGNLCRRIQRQRFLTEEVLATDPKKTMLWRVGRTESGRFAYQWR